MFINWKQRELNLKIVYYGPALSGKTTNLQAIHRRINPGLRSDLVSLNTREDRTVFFDFMQLELKPIRGLTPKFSLYTVPGQVLYASSRKLVLRGADGVVFVADSQRSRMDANVDSFRAMHRHLDELGLDPALVPCVVQFNKRDLADIAPVSLLRHRLSLDGQPTFESVAIEGVGVLETLKASIRHVMTYAKGQIQTKKGYQGYVSRTTKQPVQAVSG
jgi:hypothetical protein